jgi:hypothetical protein
VPLPPIGQKEVYPGSGHAGTSTAVERDMKMEIPITRVTKKEKKGWWGRFIEKLVKAQQEAVKNGCKA